jgi:hypothetical protein
MMAQASSVPERGEPGTLQWVRTETVLGKAEDEEQSHHLHAIASGANEWANNPVDIDNLPQKVYTGYVQANSAAALEFSAVTDL